MNRAARLESLCKELNVPLVITAEVWSHLEESDKNKFKAFEGQHLKGIPKALNVYGLIL